ncbi:MAG: SURF1 family protein [Marinovum sp.]|nr:SURF1 family protein [Marinovum sp.]
MRRIFVPLFLGLAGGAILVSLGLWQVNRLAWKEEVLAKIDGRISAMPVALPQTPNPGEDRYLAVQVTGKLSAEALYVLTSRKRVGAGYLVVSPFTTVAGRRILVDRGFVPIDARGNEWPKGDTWILGNLNWPDDRTSSTPKNDEVQNIWFARDVEDMARSLQTEPLMIIAADAEIDMGTEPLAVDTSAVPNDHLEYAITWFSLAAIWIVMSLAWAMRIHKRES